VLACPTYLAFYVEYAKVMEQASEDYSISISTRGLDPVSSSSAGVWYSNQRSKTNEKEKDGTSVIATTYATIEAITRTFCRKL